ncbi:hypothetical protein [Leptotrichia sp. oral taxon 847]|uniref:hypothetical protein n=1 Tax=Leptotrichia sp. oral taxon 847 TaxID=1785996 RepID=UPI000767E23C|nr:hypothetical protein [Leptotrichia sp. oral taxon 847]AMD94425.1 hypothetical protein AXF11_01650 [Leptotrichia sp. oral taxon 847]
MLTFEATLTAFDNAAPALVPPVIVIAGVETVFVVNVTPLVKLPEEFIDIAGSTCGNVIFPLPIFLGRLNVTVISVVVFTIAFSVAFLFSTSFFVPYCTSSGLNLA